MELLCSLGDASRPHHAPEIVQVMVIEPFHRDCETVKYKLTKPEILGNGFNDCANLYCGLGGTDANGTEVT